MFRNCHQEYIYKCINCCKMIKTIINLPPKIKQNFNKYLLDDYLSIVIKKYCELLFYASKKIRPSDVGKSKDWDNLTKQFNELYERKVKEKEDYKTEIKNRWKRPFETNTNYFGRFGKMDTE